MGHYFFSDRGKLKQSFERSLKNSDLSNNYYVSTEISSLVAFWLSKNMNIEG